MGWLSSLAGALGDFVGLGDLGSAIGGGLDYAQQRKDAKKADMRAFNQALYMSNTAHQREVEDLRAAGLNPVLSAMGGAGASTPALGSHVVDDKGTEAYSRAQLAEQKRINDSVIEKNKADADLSQAQADKVRDTWQLGDIINPDDIRNVISGVVNNGFQVSELPNYLRGIFGIPLPSSGVHNSSSVGRQVANASVSKFSSKGASSDKPKVDQKKPDWWLAPSSVEQIEQGYYRRLQQYQKQGRNLTMSEYLENFVPVKVAERYMKQKGLPPSMLR